jgi:hypothetical protein
MYAKNLPVPLKFDYPYQQQQRYSGSFVVADNQEKPKKLSEEVLRLLDETTSKLVSSKK